MSLYELEAFGLIEKATTNEELVDILKKYGDYGSVWLRVMARKEALDSDTEAAYADHET